MQLQLDLSIQSEELEVDPLYIDLYIEALHSSGPDSVMSTLVTPIYNERNAHRRDVVKCFTICNRCVHLMISKSGKFLPEATSYLRHVTMYAFRKDFVLEFSSLSLSDLEESEDLE
ncbi:hypothetical protein DD238_002910 [Peronospora effusa]|uniref:Uncharacterized protein n=1 Tax=Peronospora effusa TaxID=542832 RepID=A0A3M6VFS6_9STRA|nr:hypothetical protein DD238_002910 [Peronospora effusa]